jgi:starch-binding outer membrane protein SusE/F
MKNILKTTIFAFLLVALGSCENDIEAVATKQAGAKLLTPASGTELVLLETNQDDVATTLVWDYSDFGVETAASYTVEIAKAGTDFKTPIAAGTTTERFLTWTVKELNDVLIKAGFTPAVQSSIEVRIAAKLGTSTNAIQQYSNVITLKVTPYTGLLAYDKTDWFLIGAAVKGGWDNNADTDHQPMFRDGKNANKYSFIGYFLAGEFKLISVKGSWASQVGKASATEIEIKDNAGAFVIATAGYYKFTFDTTAKTYTLAPYTATLKSYTTIGMIGTATADGWNSDQDMAKSTFDPHVWTVKIDLTKAETKFRAENAWDTSWGGTTAFSSIGGTGDNIPVAGKSKFIVYFSDIDGSYSMIPNQK